jgi:hypothetical protein
MDFNVNFCQLQAFVYKSINQTQSQTALGTTIQLNLHHWQPTVIVSSILETVEISFSLSLLKGVLTSRHQTDFAVRIINFYLNDG